MSPPAVIRKDDRHVCDLPEPVNKERLSLAVARREAPVRYWEIIADDLSQAGFSWGCSSETDATGRVIFTADAYSRDGRRFTVLSHEKFAAFLELRRAIHRQLELG